MPLFGPTQPQLEASVQNEIDRHGNCNAALVYFSSMVKQRCSRGPLQGSSDPFDISGRCRKAIRLREEATKQCTLKR